MGFGDFEWVQVMNVVATRAAICIAIALSRRCYFMIENPRQSTVGSFPYFDYMLQIAHQLDLYAGMPDLQQTVFWWLTCNYYTGVMTINL